MPVVSMKQLLEAGVHFGHQTRRWNPKMSKYIFTQRNGIHIIDLQKTVNGLDEAFEYVRNLAAEGEKMLFVGTKKQAQEAVRDEALRANQFFVNQRWLGGLLTNFKTIQERLRRLDELERMKTTGEMELRPKKEQLRLGDEMAKLNRLLGGIRTMRRLPAALFIVDCQKEHLAVHEASRLDIPIVALVDTNADPDPVAYPIPANDDAIRAVRLLAGRIADAAIEGQQMRESSQADQTEDESAEVETESAEYAADVSESDRPVAFDEEIGASEQEQVGGQGDAGPPETDLAEDSLAREAGLETSSSEHVAEETGEPVPPTEVEPADNNQEDSSVPVDAARATLEVESELVAGDDMASSEEKTSPEVIEEAQA